MVGIECKVIDGVKSCDEVRVDIAFRFRYEDKSGVGGELVNFAGLDSIEC